MRTAGWRRYAAPNEARQSPGSILGYGKMLGEAEPKRAAIFHREFRGIFRTGSNRIGALR
jgi:hypothetical protein